MENLNPQQRTQGVSASLPLYSDLSSDPDMHELLDLFVGEMPARARRIAALFGTHDWKGLAGEAHKLRGAAGGHGFRALGIAAGELEELLRAHAGREADAHDDVRVRVDQIVSMCRRCAVRRAA
jgi:HPt (histidine-containing phosphotransfer) domain-containing protein